MKSSKANIQKNAMQREYKKIPYNLSCLGFCVKRITRKGKEKNEIEKRKKITTR